MWLLTSQTKLKSKLSLIPNLISNHPKLFKLAFFKATIIHI